MENIQESKNTTENIQEPKNTTEDTQKPKKTKTSKILIILAWIIPILIILIILYYNFLPFGYQRTLTINVGDLNDSKGEFYLEESDTLSNRQSVGEENFRFLDGLAYAIYKPKVILENAEIEAVVEGEGISFLVSPDTDIKWGYNWDLESMSKNFQVETSEEDIYNLLKSSEAKEKDNIKVKSNEIFGIEVEWLADINIELLKGDISLTQNPKNLIFKYGENEIIYSLPDFFIGKNQTALIGFDNKNIYLFINGEQVEKRKLPQIKEGEEKNLNINKGKNANLVKLYPEIKPKVANKDDCVYLDGNTKLVLPNSADKFEVGPFVIYLEWIPEKREESQQIIGHYNWEISQNKENVKFTIGRMNDSDGNRYSISHDIKDDFFYKKHKLLVIYNPADEKNINGYADLFIDDTFAGRQYFANEKIWPDYGNYDLSLGQSMHSSGQLPYFQGSVCDAKFSHTRIDPKVTSTSNFLANGETIKIPLWGVGKLTEIEIKVKK